MTACNYILMDPTGNLTLLVDTPVSPALQPRAAARLMEREPAAEQVGFVSFSGGEVRLRMAGGEFCGNASMCAAALGLRQAGRNEGTITVHVAGAERPVPVTVSALPEGGWRGAVSMPPPLSLDTTALPDGQLLPVVRFPGIAHVILEDAPGRENAEVLAKQWCRALGTEALGLMFLDRRAEALTPLVYVPGADTLFWERSCASGTAAVGAWLAREASGRIARTLAQPGGALRIEADPGGGLLLTGTVRIRRRGSAALDL